MQIFGALLVSFLSNKEAVELGRRKTRMMLAGLQPDWLVRGNQVENVPSNAPVALLLSLPSILFLLKLQLLQVQPTASPAAEEARREGACRGEGEEQMEMEEISLA